MLISNLIRDLQAIEKLHPMATVVVDDPTWNYPPKVVGEVDVYTKPIFEDYPHIDDYPLVMIHTEAS